jgi:NAD(P)-dependent dehydrogenase (short-subunit alcohol dehydrogenase family)
MAGLDIRLTGRPCLVVGGGGGGIGSAIVAAVAAAGAPTAIITNVAAHADEGSAQLEAAGVPHAAVVADALDEAELVAAIDDLEAALGTFRHLVNVVGGGFALAWTDRTDMTVFDRAIAMNLRYAVVSCREIARRLRASGNDGSIVNVSSLAERGAPLLAAYGAAKAGLSSFSRTMALELGHYGIRVNVVELGAIRRIDTPPADEEAIAAATATIPLRRQGGPADVASGVLFLLSDLAGYITGQTLAIDGGLGMGYPGGPSPFIPASLLPPCD